MAKRRNRPLFIAGATTTLVIVVLALSFWTFCVSEGTFIILSLTLVAVVWYTYFTRLLATKKDEVTVVATIHYVPEARDLRVFVKNPTNRYAKTRIWVNVKVYGEDTDLGPEYSGQTIWHLTPQFEIDGHFSLDNPLRQAGKSFDAMVTEACEEDVTKQLQLRLKVEWEDEDGEVGKLPERCWYFDFRKNSFVYSSRGLHEYIAGPPASHAATIARSTRCTPSANDHAWAGCQAVWEGACRHYLGGTANLTP